MLVSFTVTLALSPTHTALLTTPSVTIRPLSIVTSEVPATLTAAPKPPKSS